ncbi:MAG: hypothetical protein J0H18_14020 [Rhizobiales bacterium]|nr:hypothetical protein [Hyphomicrobiales bacterium]OJX98801.1 MAG: hypothetical protein BGP07_13850 [Rhizobiales bacterium 63-22]
MRLWKPYGTGTRAAARANSAPRGLSRLPVMLLSLLLLVSAQFCHAMPSDMMARPAVADTVPVHTMNMRATRKSSPVDHGMKAAQDCMMMVCSCLVFSGMVFALFTPLSFGRPPLESAIRGGGPHGVLRPPIPLRS